MCVVGDRDDDDRLANSLTVWFWCRNLGQNSALPVMISRIQQITK